LIKKPNSVDKPQLFKIGKQSRNNSFANSNLAHKQAAPYSIRLQDE